MLCFCDRLGFVYVDSEGNDVVYKDQAAVLIDGLLLVVMILIALLCFHMETV